MKFFSRLINELECTSDNSLRFDKLLTYFRNTDSSDAVWALYFLTGEKIKKIIDLNKLCEWSKEFCGIPNWLFEASLSAVGDTAETIALLLHPNQNPENIPFNKFINEFVLSLNNEKENVIKEKVFSCWIKFDTDERIFFNKIITGSLRIGKYSGITKKAFAKIFELNEAILDQSLKKNWTPTLEFFNEMISYCKHGRNFCQPYPFHESIPCMAKIDSDSELNSWFVEYKWDGIRAQLMKRNGEAFLWTRNNEYVNDKFPEIVSAINEFGDGITFDGIIICTKNNNFLPSVFLNRRLRKKSLNKKDFEEIQPVYKVFDILENNGKDIRSNLLSERREIIKSVFADCFHPNLNISELLEVNCMNDLTSFCNKARNSGADALILKRISSTYKDNINEDWQIIKSDPFRMNAVLLYVQRSYERSLGPYSEFTFGLWNGNTLISAAKVQPELNNNEIMEIDDFIKQNTLERIGPVRVIKPCLVFEIAFDNIERSKRHKCGFLLKNPFILSWRKEKLPHEADTLKSLEML